jgi:hypothetical protein
MLRWRLWIASLSLANLVYLRGWAELLDPNSNNLYWLKYSPSPVRFIAHMMSVVLLGVVLYGVGVAVGEGRKLATRLAPVFGVVILISLVNSLRTLIGSQNTSQFLRFVEQRLPAIGVVLAIAMIIALLTVGMRAIKPVYRLLILVAPFVAITFGEAAYRLAIYDPNVPSDGPLAARLPDKPAGAPRVLWVIFDEWDHDLTYADRPARISLPEIDRLTRNVFSGDQAIRANMFTDWSMPALVTGLAVKDVHPDGPSELMMRLTDSNDWIRWSQQDNVFRRARGLGFNTSVVAWAIPYCRVLKADLSDCWWWSGSNQYNSNGDALGEILLNEPRSLFENVYRSPFGQSLATHRHAWVYENVLTKSLEVARDRKTGFALLHFPVPHPPYFFDAASGQNDHASRPGFGLLQQNQKGYPDALALTDRAIGALRRAMEEAGTWDATTVIFSADHPFRHRPELDGRPVSQRVPYLIKAAGRNQQLRYANPFSALLTRKLIVAFLSGELSRSDQVPGWLDAHRSDYPTD